MRQRLPVSRPSPFRSTEEQPERGTGIDMYTLVLTLMAILTVLMLATLVLQATRETCGTVVCDSGTTVMTPQYQTTNYYTLACNTSGNFTGNLTACDWCSELYAILSNISGSCTSPPPARRLARGERVPRALESCAGLTQADFDGGTYIIDTPSTCYVLLENVSFAPNAAYDYRPTANQTAYQAPGFVLGFFAAISIQTHDVLLDLGGFTLSQSVEHQLAQRFFALIELADRPFVPGQGPANFGTDTTRSATRTVIRNGVLGVNSHHGIHGNFNANLMLQDLDIVNFEVAAVALNGASNVILSRVRALGTNTRVPVLATFSQTRFLLPFAYKALAQFAGTDAAAEARLLNATARLELLANQTFADVVASGAINATAHPDAWALFGNPSGRTDGGSNYGLLFVDKSPAVNGFSCDRGAVSNLGMHNILVQDCQVRNVVGEPREVVTLNDAQGGVNRGPAGDVLRFEDAMNLTTGAYAGTPLFDVQVALAALVGNATGGYGTLHVHPGVLAWALNGSSLAPYVQNGTFEWLRNGDSMHHVMKGPVALRVDGGSDVVVRDSFVLGVTNHAAAAKLTPFPGETDASVYYSNGEDGGHPGQDPQGGFMGADVRGVSLAAVQNVVLLRTDVRNVHTEHGWAHGVDVFNDAASVLLQELRVYNVTSLQSVALEPMGPKIGRAVGVRALSNAQTPVLVDLVVEDVETAFLGLAYNTLYEHTDIRECAADTVNFYAS